MTMLAAVNTMMTMTSLRYYADKEDAYDMRKMFETGLKKQEANHRC
jgi:hypothetical protein